VFKKVIGQDQGETSGSASSHSETQAPEAAISHDSGYGASSRSSRSGGSTRNVLSSDVEIKGNVKFTDDLVIDGRIEGEIASAGSLTIGENARIKAEIRTGTIIVYGKVHGNLTATDRIDIKSSAEVVGDVKAKTLSIEAGAIFVGKSTVGTPEQAPASKPAASSKPAATSAPAETTQQGTLAGTETSA